MIYHIDRLKEKGIKGAVYDLDGTIADSMGVWQDIYRELFSYYRIPFDGDFLSKTNHIAMAERAELLAETYLPNQTKEEVLSYSAIPAKKCGLNRIPWRLSKSRFLTDFDYPWRPRPTQYAAPIF